MYHPAAVRVIERQRHFPNDAHRFVDRQRALPEQPVPQVLALDERHREPELARGLSGVVDAQDVGMLEPGGDLDFPLEPLVAHGGGELGEHDLERHRPVPVDVVREVHRGHPSATQLALDLVPAREGGAKGLEAVRQGDRGREGA